MGRIVIDGAEEIERLGALVARRRVPQSVWLRLSPGIDVDTHVGLRTATLDSKFGAPITTGDALAQALAIVATRGLRLTGIHAHLGTQLHEAGRYGELARSLVAFARQVRTATGVTVREIALGGGLGIPLRAEDRTLDLDAYAKAVSGPVRADPLTAPAVLYLEPGRSLVGRAGVALYRVVGTKRVPGVRTFVSVDGGMGDNIRPAPTALGTPRSSRIGRRTPRRRPSRSPEVLRERRLLVRDVASSAARPGETIAVPGPARTRSRWPRTTTTSRVRRWRSSTAAGRGSSGAARATPTSGVWRRARSRRGGGIRGHERRGRAGRVVSRRPLSGAGEETGSEGTSAAVVLDVV